MVACFTRSSLLSFRAATFSPGFLSHHVQWTKRKTDNPQSRWLTECVKLVISHRLFLEKRKIQKSENYWYRQRIVRIVQDTSIQHI